MKNLRILLLAVIMMAAGCTDNFEDINRNGNQPEVVTPDLVLASVISNSLGDVALRGWREGNQASQLIAKINFTGFDRYAWGSNGLWNTMYNNLTEVEIILELARGEQTRNTSYEGIALVLRSWMYANLTDLFVDVPFTEAIQGRSEGNFTPAYDTQESIYDAILADLATANDLLAQGQSIFGGDLLYGGDVASWRKLANSLRLRYLMRISNRRDVSAQMQQIVDNAPIFESVADNAVMDYPATGNQDSWPYSTFRIGSFDEHRLSLTSEGVLKDFDDPRLSTWFQPTDNPDDDPTLITGMPNGLSEDNASTYNGGAQNVSRLNQGLFFDCANCIQAPLMQYAEVEFILAEAAQKGMISGSAQTYYEAGIQASFDYWSTEMPADYLTRTGVAYDGQLETIITQKWLASFMVGFEAWFDFRRTGLPSIIVPGPDNVNNDRVPVRFTYPSSEQTLNPQSYQAAVSRLGEDDINIKGWWDL